ncbi:MAG: PEGA domain-containing protein [Myxococcaceae bacterium]|nr:PEGA domain-containing protein [Myxococcaceae bacterium]
MSAPRPPSKRGLSPVTDPLQPAVPSAVAAERTDPSGKPLEPEEERTSPSNPVLPGAKALLAQAAASASRAGGETTGPVQVPWDVSLGSGFEPATGSMPVAAPQPEPEAPPTTEEPPPPDERTHVVNVESLRPSPKKKAAKQKASAAKARTDAASEVTSPGTPLPPGLRLPPRRTLLFAGGALALVLLVGGAIAAMSPSAPRNSAVIVRCVPAVEAQITVAGRLLTPGVATQLPPGDYDLVALAPGFKTHTQRISVIAGEQVTQVTVLLEALPSAGGAAVARPAVDAGAGSVAVAEQFSARFTGTPGAEVLVDGVLVGTLPGARAEQLTVGRTYAWLVRKAGFTPASGTLSAAAPEEKSVVAELKPAGAVAVRPQNPGPTQPQGTGFLVCTSVPPGAQVIVDGKGTGRKTPILPDAPLELGAGKHAVVLELNGTRSPARNVTVEPQKMVKLFNVKVEDTEILETPDLDTP